MYEEEFEKLLTKDLKEYIEKKEQMKENIPKIKFSRKHKKQMKELFNSIK